MLILFKIGNFSRKYPLSGNLAFKGTYWYPGVG